MNWGHFFGGQITCEFPFLVIMLIGYFFAKLGAITYDGCIVLAKLSIEVFLPCYIFIQVCRSTTKSYIEENAAVIISQLIIMTLSFSAAFIYATLSKIDVRYKWTFIALVTITEVKYLNYLQVSSFCYHVLDKNPTEITYCSKIDDSNYSHMFFQGIFSWYIFFYGIRRDREHWRTIVEVGRDIAKAYETAIVLDDESSSDEEEEESLIRKRKSTTKSRKDTKEENDKKDFDLEKDNIIQKKDEELNKNEIKETVQEHLETNRLGVKETERNLIKQDSNNLNPQESEMNQLNTNVKKVDELNNSKLSKKSKIQAVDQQKTDTELKNNDAINKDNKVDSNQSKNKDRKLSKAEQKEAKKQKKIDDEKLKKEKQAMYDEFDVNLLTRKDNTTLQANTDFYEKVEEYYHLHLHKHKSDIKPWWYKASYVIFGPCQIALFTGFIVGFITVIRNWCFNKTGAQFIFYETLNQIGNSHLVVNYLIIGANFFIFKQHEYSFRFRKMDHVALLIFKCLILPFLGVLYVFICHEINDSNRAVLFNAYVQWITPSSIDIITMVQAKEINNKDSCINVAIQWAWLLCINTFIVNSPMLRILGF